MYCVYLTIYRGNKNKMPPFYIGSTSVEKINNGYHGPVSSKKWKETWCSEIKDNPHLFESKIVCIHHNTRQEALDKEYKLQVALNILKKSEMYINRSIASKNGFFGMDNTHKVNKPETRKRMSIAKIGHKVSEETRKKISKTKIGTPSAFLGKHHSEETRKYFSDLYSGPNSRFYGTTPHNNGKIWINNSVVQKFICSDDIIPDGWLRGMLPKKRKSGNPK